MGIIKVSQINPINFLTEFKLTFYSLLVSYSIKASNINYKESLYVDLYVMIIRCINSNK